MSQSLGNYTRFGFLTDGEITELTSPTINPGINISAISHTQIQDIGTNSHINIDSHIAATNAHGLASPILGEDDPQIITNKTINSASNTLQVNGVNINDLIDQDVRTTASPTFAEVFTEKITSPLTNLELDTGGLLLEIETTAPKDREIAFVDNVLAEKKFSFGFSNSTQASNITAWDSPLNMEADTFNLLAVTTGTTNPSLYLRDNNTLTNTRNGLLIRDNVGDKCFMGWNNVAADMRISTFVPTGIIRFETNGTERMTISNLAGNVNINTGSVSVNTGGNTGYFFGGALGYGLARAAGNGAFFANALAGDLIVKGNPANRLLFGVGDTSYSLLVSSIGTRIQSQFQIDPANVPINPASTVLALGGDSVVYRRSDIVDLASAQTMTNKTLTTPVITQINTIDLPLTVNLGDSASGRLIVNNDLQLTRIGTEFRYANAYVGRVTSNAFNNNLSLETQTGGDIQFITGLDNQLIIPAAGILTDNTGEVLARNAGTLNLVKRDNIATTDTAQTLTNKTLTNPVLTANAGATFNLLTVSAGNVIERRADVTNQQLLTTSSPTFNAANVTTSAQIGSYIYTNATSSPFLVNVYDHNAAPSNYKWLVRSAAFPGTTVLLTRNNTGNDWACTVDVWLTGFSGANDVAGSYHYANNFRKVAGVITNAGTLYTDKKENGDNGYNGKLNITFTISGNDILVNATNAAGYVIYVQGHIEIYNMYI